MLNPFAPNPFQMPGAGSLFDTSDQYGSSGDYWPPTRPVRDVPTWENSYPGGYSGYTPLANPIIDESRFWREPTAWDRMQQWWGGFLQNFEPGNMQDARTDFWMNGPGAPLMPWLGRY